MGNGLIEIRRRTDRAERPPQLRGRHPQARVTELRASDPARDRVARCDGLLKQLGQVSYARSKRAKTAMRLAFGLAVRHEVMPRNPIDGVARLHKPKRTPTA